MDSCRLFHVVFLRRMLCYVMALDFIDIMNSGVFSGQ